MSDETARTQRTDDRDAEVERILGLSDAEIIAATIAEGHDPQQIADQCRAIFERALARVGSP